MHEARNFQTSAVQLYVFHFIRYIDALSTPDRSQLAYDEMQRYFHEDN